MTAQSHTPRGANPAAPARGDQTAGGMPLWSFGGALSPLAMLEAGKPASTPLEAWISLFPASPLFGVRWVMWDLMRLGAGATMPTGGAAATRSGAAREAEVLSMPDARPLPPRQEPPQAAPPPEAAPAFEAPAAPQPVAEAAAAPAFEAVPEAPAEPVVQPVVEAAPEPAPARTPPANLLTAPPARIDDLKLIKGVGPRLETRLNELGVYLFAQIAEFTEDDFAWLDDHLAALFRGRAVRDGWADQAKTLRDSQS